MGEAKRSAGDLIAELNEHAASGRYNIGVGLILTKTDGDELLATLLDAASKHARTDVIKLVREGGSPLGFAGFWTTPIAEGGVRMEMEGWLLDEYKGDDRAGETLEEILMYFAGRIQEERT